MEFQEEPFFQIIDEFKPIYDKHWAEVGSNQDLRPAELDLESYGKLVDAEMLHCFTVRDEGKLVGFAFFFIADSIHQKSWKYAACDIFGVLPEYRKAGVGSKMFTEMEKLLRSYGANSITIHAKANNPQEKFFDKFGYAPVEIHYEKVL